MWPKICLKDSLCSFRVYKNGFLDNNEQLAKFISRRSPLASFFFVGLQDNFNQPAIIVYVRIV